MKQLGGNDKTSGRILFLATKISPLETGAEICNKKIFESLVNDGHRVDLVTEGNMPRRMIYSPLCWFSYLRRILALPRGSLIIASSGLEQRLFLPLLVAKHLKDYKIIILSYLLYNYKNDRLLKNVYRFINRVFYLQGNIIIANSNHTKSGLQALGIARKRIRIVNHGVLDDHSIAKPGTVAQERDASCIELISVGFLEHRKGYHLLLKALKDVSIPFKLTIIGSITIHPDYFKELCGLVARFDLTDKVVFAGNVENEKVLEMVAESDVYVHSSLDEGFGISVFEAASLGKAIVAFDLPVFKEFLQDGVSALLVPKGDVAKLTEALNRVMADDALRRRLGENACKLPIAHRTWSECIGEISDIIKEEAADSRPSH